MFTEKEFVPHLPSIVPGSSNVGRNLFTDPTRPVVGLVFERDEEGYVRTIFSSDDPPYHIASLADADRWLAKEDERFLFIRGGDSAMDSLLKWYGGPVSSYDGLRFTYYGSSGWLSVHTYRGGKHGQLVKHVRSLSPFYQRSLMLAEEDCRGVKAKAERLMHTLYKYDLPFTHLRSVGNIFQSLLLKRRIVTDVRKIPYGALEMAQNCYHTNWHAAFYLGHFKESWDYDTVSAFPYQTAQLVSSSPTYGDWVQTVERVNGAAYGFMRAVIKVEPSHFHPVLTRIVSKLVGKGKMVRYRNGWGNWVGYITMEEYDFLRNVGARVQVQDAWWFVPKVVVKPFEAPMGYLLGVRKLAKSRNDMFLYNLCKLIATTPQGKFISRRTDVGSLGTLFNPVYAAAITARSRVALALFCLPHSKNVLHIAIDGALLNKYVEPQGLEAGMVRLENSGESIIATDMEYWMPNKPTSAYLKDSLERAGDGSEYVRALRPHYTTIAEAGSEAFSRVGLRDDRSRTGKLEKLEYAQRLFFDLPTKCSDLLEHQYDSEMKQVGGYSYVRHS